MTTFRRENTRPNIAQSIFRVSRAQSTFERKLTFSSAIHVTEATFVLWSTFEHLLWPSIQSQCANAKEGSGYSRAYGSWIFNVGHTAHHSCRQLTCYRHGVTYNMRSVGLANSLAGNTLTVTGPPNANIYPPGFAWLYVLVDGVPSQGYRVMVGDGVGSFALGRTLSDRATEKSACRRGRKTQHASTAQCLSVIIVLVVRYSCIYWLWHGQCKAMYIPKLPLGSVARRHPRPVQYTMNRGS